MGAPVSKFRYHLARIESRKEMKRFCSQSSLWGDRASLPGSQVFRMPEDDPYDFCFIKLSKQNIFLVKTTWRIAKLRDVGVSLLITLLIRKPSLAKHYGIYHQGINAADLKTEDAVLLQGKRIEKLLDCVVQSFDYASATKRLQKKCAKVGKIHYQHGVNFARENWLAFRQASIEEILSPVVINVAEKEIHHINEESVKQAWIILLDEIIKQMQDGFIKEANKHCAISFENIRPTSTP